MGIAITVDHNNGYTTAYANLSALAGLKVGDPVKAGQTIGFVGQSMLEESAMAPHLHLQMLRDGVSVDPLLIIGK